MKNMLLVFYCLLGLATSQAEIRNGFNPELVAARYAIAFLDRELLRSDLSDHERRKMHVAMKEHTSAIASYQLTDALLKQMSLIAPEMYGELNELRDKRGRITDIYVRFILQERSSVPLSGASFFQASDVDEDASYSRYGDYTVAIDIWICDAALNLLAHEFGHTRYIVPNMASYRKFYTNTYGSIVNPTRRGHSAADASGKLAYQYGQQYLRDRREFRRSAGTGPEKVAMIIKQIRKRVREEFEEELHSTVASSQSY